MWDNPETSFEEFEAVKLITRKLEENGFNVTYNVAGISTAFKATYGEGSPSLGVLAEYDGLFGMSQEAGATVAKPIPGKEKNHSCGHHLFAGGSIAAVLAVKDYIEKTGKGKITLFGCPAEEGGAGKVYMARDGVFNEVESIGKLASRKNVYGSYKTCFSKCNG